MGPKLRKVNTAFLSSDWFRRFIELSPSFGKSLRQQSVENSEFRSDTLEDNRHCIGIGIGKKLMTNLRLNSNHPNNDAALRNFAERLRVWFGLVVAPRTNLERLHS